jgi:hypothetical protein
MNQPLSAHTSRIRTYIYLFSLLTGLAIFVSLELLRWHSIATLRHQGYALWGISGFYVQSIPGHLLCITWMQDHFTIFIASVLGGCGIYLLISIFLPKELRARPSSPSSLKLWTARGLVGLICLFILGQVYGAYIPSPIIAIDFDHGVVTSLDGSTIPLSNIVSIGNHSAEAGRPKGWYIDALTKDGTQIDLLPVRPSRNYYLPFEAQHITTSLQGFLTSHDQTFPSQ